MNNGRSVTVPVGWFAARANELRVFSTLKVQKVVAQGPDQAENGRGELLGSFGRSGRQTSDQEPSTGSDKGLGDERYGQLLSQVAAGRLNRITAERLHQGLTQNELASRTGMRQPNISRLERLGTTMHVVTAQRLAMALGLDDYRELLP